MQFHQVLFETSFGLAEQLPPSELPEVAFAGRSNVGKSSLINKLFQRKNLARVSSMPGKTTTINFFRLPQLRIVDLPGYGYAKVSRSEKRRWGELMESYFRSERDIRLVVQLLDIRHVPTEDDLQMVNFLIDSEIPFLIALTKCDKLKKSQREGRIEAMRGELPCAEQLTVLPVSGETGEGIPELQKILEEIAEEDGAREE